MLLFSALCCLGQAHGPTEARSAGSALFRAQVLAASSRTVQMDADLLLTGNVFSGAGGQEEFRSRARSGQALFAARLDSAAGQKFVLLDRDGIEVLSMPLFSPSPGIGGTAFNRRDRHQPLAVAEYQGLRLGLASLHSGELELERMAGQGADLVLLAGGPAGRAQVVRFARQARRLRLALLIVGDCRSATTCIASAAITAGGDIAWNNGAILSLHHPANGAGTAAFGLPPRLPQPYGREASTELAALGRVLFFSPALSGSGQVACSDCHRPEAAFADPRPRSLGADGTQTMRNAPGLLNVAFRSNLRWDGWSGTLEQFVKNPVAGKGEMAAHDLSATVRRVTGVPGMGRQFAAAFGSRQIDFPRIELALGAYLRTLVSGNSAFDRAILGGDNQAMSPSAWRGYRLFQGRAGCAACHSWSPYAPFFTDQRLHATGWGWDPVQLLYRDPGAGALGAASLNGQFRTPTLRDVALTAPYMHDGRLQSLREVIDFFDRGGTAVPNRDLLLRPLGLSEQDKRDLEQFLIALTGSIAYSSDGRRINQP